MSYFSAFLMHNASKRHDLEPANWADLLGTVAIGGICWLL